MMKNTEWGAMAYLANSEYGRGNSEVVSNFDTNYTTGGGNYKVNINQSTTNNITGIYDTSGGALEYVMGNLNNTSSSSGFTSWPDSKYYDKYIGTDVKTSGILGDATFETYNWFGDRTEYVTYDKPWFLRGGGQHIPSITSNETANGLFDFSMWRGNAYPNGGETFRIVLSPTN